MKRRRPPGPKPELKRSVCPIANALDLVGDKWTLLVIRDFMFLGKRRYGEFIRSPEGIPSNILADRLKRLEGTGLVTKKPYQRRPVRYEYRLTPRGADLLPVLKEIIRWANRHIPGTAAPPPGFFEKIEKQGFAQPKRDRHRAKPALQAPRPSRIRKLGKPVRPATIRRKVK